MMPPTQSWLLSTNLVFVSYAFLPLLLLLVRYSTTVQTIVALIPLFNPRVLSIPLASKVVARNRNRLRTKEKTFPTNESKPFDNDETAVFRSCESFLKFWKTSTGLTSPSARWPLPNILAGGYARWLQSDQSTSSERSTSHHFVAGYGD